MKRSKLISPKTGKLLGIIGLSMFFLNILTYGLWEIDIDIWGALIFIIGFIILAISCRSGRKSAC